MWNHVKTVLLLGALSGVLLGIGALIGGKTGLTVMLVIAVLMNFGMFFFSHKLVLAMYGAKPADKKEYKHIHSMVEELSRELSLPKPQLYIVPTATPNAFATGPTQKKAIVACTEGILDLLTHEELKGVLAHELGHIKNRDMLVTTIAATIATVISYVAGMARFAALFGSRDDDSGNLLGLIILGILSPIIALVLQLAISRSREYLADETGARVLKNGAPLANALNKLEHGVRAKPLRGGNPTTSSLFIVNPFTAEGLVSLFSTHPSTKNRVDKLLKMKF